MSIDITVAGVAYPVPSGASDVDWAAQQVALLQAMAAAVGSGPAVQRLFANITPVGTGADTTEDTLMTYTLPAGLLSANGKGVRITAWGTGINTANATTVRAYFGSFMEAVVLTASQANTWRASIDVLRVNSAAQTCCVGFGVGGTAQSSVTDVVSLDEDLTASVVIKFTGQRATSSVADSIIQEGMLVELIP